MICLKRLVSFETRAGAEFPSSLFELRRGKPEVNAQGSRIQGVKGQEVRSQKSEGIEHGAHFSSFLTMNNTDHSNIVKVTAAILVKDDRILIARRGPDDYLADKWEFPGGKIEIHETPEQCLKREMKEEFDIEVSVGAYLGSSIYHYDHMSIELLAYRTYWEGGKIDLKDHDEFKWISLEQLAGFDFAPADRVFIEKLQNRDIAV
jgi:8-oxo-dGTP diphosphatase